MFKRQQGTMYVDKCLDKIRRELMIGYILKQTQVTKDEIHIALIFSCPNRSKYSGFPSHTELKTPKTRLQQAALPIYQQKLTRSLYYLHDPNGLDESRDGAVQVDGAADAGLPVGAVAVDGVLGEHHELGLCGLQVGDGLVLGRRRRREVRRAPVRDDFDLQVRETPPRRRVVRTDRRVPLLRQVEDHRVQASL